jgi:di/tricarboxylate transporter
MAAADDELVVLAVQRQGQDLGPGPSRLQAGDTLLVQGAWPTLAGRRKDPGVLVVDDPGQVRRQVVPLGPGAKRALTVVAAMIVLLASGAVPAAVAGALAAGALVLVRVLDPEQAYRAIDWTTIILIGGMIAVSDAIRESGAGEDVAGLLVDGVGGAGPHALLAGLFLLTAAFGQVISNTATALIVIPIAVSAAAELDLSAHPVQMTVAVESAAAFLTPIATPANMMVAGPAGYRFGDYWRLGLAMLGLFFMVGVFLVPAIWSF